MESEIGVPAIDSQKKGDSIGKRKQRRPEIRLPARAFDSVSFLFPIDRFSGAFRYLKVQLNGFLPIYSTGTGK